VTTTELPRASEVDASIKLITDNAQRIFLWDYERSREQLVTLYNKAMSSQWSSVTDLDWSINVDPEALVASSPQQNLMVEIARGAADLPGSPFAKWGETDFVQLGIESLKASLSQFMHGEQGAMMVAAKIVETVPGSTRSTTPLPRRWTRHATPRCSPNTSTPSSARPTR
jgi:hypothetical protein